jgi:hypothetical protein
MLINDQKEQIIDTYNNFDEPQENDTEYWMEKAISKGCILNDSINMTFVK